MTLFIPRFCPLVCVFLAPSAPVPPICGKQKKPWKHWISQHFQGFPLSPIKYPALPSGPRGRGFKSRHSDHKKVCNLNDYRLFHSPEDLGFVHFYPFFIPYPVIRVTRVAGVAVPVTVRPCAA